MNSELDETDKKTTNQSPSETKKNIGRLKVLATILTVLGISVFSYFIYSVGLNEIFAGIANMGIGGFIIIQLIYLSRIYMRAVAWRSRAAGPVTR